MNEAQTKAEDIDPALKAAGKGHRHRRGVLGAGGQRDVKPHYPERA